MSQNNMITYITLTDLDADKVEVNPAFIVMMRRDTYEPEEGVEMPFTKVILSTNHQIYALETPEQVAQLQMDSVTNVMKSVMNTTYNMLEDTASSILDQLEEE
jgi:hypothetical protein